MATTMNEIMNPSAVQIDADFPQAPAGWTRATATTAAAEEDIELTPDHWDTIRALQAFFAQPQKPSVRELHDALNEHFHAAGGLKYVYRLFPGGPVAQGCRFAGLDAPAGTADKSFGSVQ